MAQEQRFPRDLGKWSLVCWKVGKSQGQNTKYSPWRTAKRPGRWSVSVWEIRERKIYGSSSASGNQEEPLTEKLKCCSTGTPCTDHGNLGSSWLLFQSKRGLQPHQTPYSLCLGLRHGTGSGAGRVGSGSWRAGAATYKLWGCSWIKIIELTLQVFNFFIHQNFQDILYDIPQSGLCPNKPEYPSRFSARRKELWKEKHPENSQLQ